MTQLKTIKPKRIGMDRPEKSYYPSISFSSKNLPEIKNWQVGKTYRLIVEVKQTSMRENENGEINAEFDIKKIATKESNQKNQELRNKIRDL